MLSKCGYAYLSLLTEPIEAPRTGKYEFAQRLFLLLIIYFIKKRMPFSIRKAFFFIYNIS